MPLDLTAAARFVHERLQAKHDARERALRASRRSVRFSADAIRASHRGERDRATQLAGQARAALDDAEDGCAGLPEVAAAGFIHDARKEYAEACATFALVTGEPVAGPDELRIDEAAWCNGLAEAVGEGRRHLLDELRAGRLQRSEAVLADMDDIYALLVTLDFPDGVTAGLRRSTDVARSILERTRGDLTAALVQDRLRAALDAHRRDLPTT